MADYVLTATAVIPSSSATLQIVSLFETMTAGQAAYIQTTGSVPIVGKCKANGNATIRTFAGIMATGGSTGQYAVMILSDTAGLTLGTTTGTVLAAGNSIIVSGAVAGSLAPDSDNTTGWYKTTLGIGLSTTTIKFSPVASGVAT